MKNITKFVAATLLMASSALIPNVCEAAKEKLNYYYENGSYLDIKDPIGDDKGNGYYQYPSDKRLKRGTFDIKNFRVFDENEVVVFEIQMRNSIMRTWSDTGKSDDNGFVANLWDIYVDIDGIENSGNESALPGRDVLFADKMGWEKVIMICPMNSASAEEIIREMTDELDFQDIADDIIIPDYVEIHNDKVIVKISKKKLPRISEKSGYQCFALGYKNIVSDKRLFNRDVKAFPTNDDFGGGSNEYGEPTVIDIIVPKNEDQYKLLNNFSVAAYRDNIRYAEVPFVYAGGERVSPAVQALRRAPGATPIAQTQQIKQPVQTPTVPQQQMQMQRVIPTQAYPAQQVQQQQQYQQQQQLQQQQLQQQRYYQQQQMQQRQYQQGQQLQQNTNPNGFVPLKQNNRIQNQQPTNNVPSGFVPVKKN